MSGQVPAGLSVTTTGGFRGFEFIERLFPPLRKIPVGGLVDSLQGWQLRDLFDHIAVGWCISACITMSSFDGRSRSVKVIHALPRSPQNNAETGGTREKIHTGVTVFRESDVYRTGEDTRPSSPPGNPNP